MRNLLIAFFILAAGASLCRYALSDVPKSPQQGGTNNPAPNYSAAVDNTDNNTADNSTVNATTTTTRTY